MTIIEAVRDFISTYPGLSGGRINVDFLEPDAQGYSVDVVPVKEIVKQYMDGSTVRQFLFVLATRAYYGPDIRQQMDNLGFFEGFAGWLEACSRSRRFPSLGEGRTVQKMEVTTSGYAFIPGTDTARYQAQCRIQYFAKGVRK